MKVIHPKNFTPAATIISGWAVLAVGTLLIGGYLYLNHRAKKLDNEIRRNG